MRDGVIERLGAPREIYERPATRNSFATFLGASNLIDATVVERRRLLTGRGRLRPLRAGGQPSTGERLRLAYPPERVLLKPGRDAGALPAIVRDVVYARHERPCLPGERRPAAARLRPERGQRRDRLVAGPGGRHHACRRKASCGSVAERWTT